MVQQHQRHAAHEHRHDLQRRRVRAAAGQPAERARRSGRSSRARSRRRSRTSGRSTTSASRSRTRCCFKNTGSTPDNPPVQFACRRTCRRTRRSTRRSTTTAPAAPTRCRSATAASRRWATSACTTPAPTRPSAATRTRIRRAIPASRRSRAMYGQDTMSDNFPNLNFYASGTVHGPGGYDKPSEGLLRGVEFVATYFSYAVASDRRGGAIRSRTARSPTSSRRPKKADGHHTVTYDAGFSRDAERRHRRSRVLLGLRRRQPAWQTTNPKVTHTFPTQAGWHDVKLLVSRATGRRRRRMSATTARWSRSTSPRRTTRRRLPAGAPAAHHRSGRGPVRDAVERRAERDDRSCEGCEARAAFLEDAERPR